MTPPKKFYNTVHPALLTVYHISELLQSCSNTFRTVSLDWMLPRGSEGVLQLKEIHLCTLKRIFLFLIVFNTLYHTVKGGIGLSTETYILFTILGLKSHLLCMKFLHCYAIALVPFFISRPNIQSPRLQENYWARHLTLFFSTSAYYKIISFILPQNEYGCVYARKWARNRLTEDADFGKKKKSSF